MTVIKWAPLYKRWELPKTGPIDYRHEGDFVDSDLLFSSKEDALRCSRNNTECYPYCTTGKACQVRVTVERIK